MLRIRPKGDQHNLYYEREEALFLYFLTAERFADSGPTFTLCEIGLWLCCSVKHSTQKEKKTTAAGRDNVLKASPHRLYRFPQLPLKLGNKILPLVSI